MTKKILTLLLSLFIIINTIFVNNFVVVAEEPNTEVTDNNSGENNNNESGGSDDFEVPPLTFSESDIDTSSFYHYDNNLKVVRKTTTTDLPASYDLRDVDGSGTTYLTPIKNQSPYGTCWTFATMASAESTYKKTTGNTLDLSESQLAWFAFTNYGLQDKLNLVTNGGRRYAYYSSGDYQLHDAYLRDDEILDNGGNYYISSFILSTGIGLSKEDSNTYVINGMGKYYPYYYSNAKYFSQYIKSGLNYTTNPIFSETYTSTNCYYSDYVLDQVSWIPMAEKNNVKKAIYDYGAVATSIYWDNENTVGGSSVPVSYNTTNKSYYYYSTSYGINHGVCIVGWDDDFPKENFNSSKWHSPSNNGAWLIRNSWGEDNYDYFWMSYEDSILSHSDNTAFQFFIVENNEDENLYQYDAGLDLDDNEINSLSTTTYEASIFNSQQDEFIKSISFFTANANTTVSVYVYKGNNVTSTGTLLSSKENVLVDNSGYFTIDLDNLAFIEKNSDYTIVVKKTCGSDIYLFYDGETSNANKQSYPNINKVINHCPTRPGINYYSTNGSSWIDFGNQGKILQVKAHTIDAEITLSQTSYTHTGSEIKPEPTVKYGSTTLTKDTDYTLSYNNNINVGTASVTVTGTGSYCGSKTIEFTITSSGTGKLISDSSITVDSIADQQYTGSSITPSVVVKDDSTTLTENTDYTLAYSNNINVGTATVTISGTGNYSGSRTVNFTITQKPITNSSITVDSITNQQYDGTAKTPDVVVKDGTTTLTKGTHYTVSYSNNINAGTATVTISGTGNYNGSKNVNFTIDKKSISDSSISIDSISNQTYTGSAIAPNVVVKDGSTTLTKGTHYTVSYSNNTNIGQATVTITGIGNYSGSRSANFEIVAVNVSASQSTNGDIIIQSSIVNNLLADEANNYITLKFGTNTIQIDNKTATKKIVSAGTNKVKINYSYFKDKNLLVDKGTTINITLRVGGTDYQTTTTTVRSKETINITSGNSYFSSANLKYSIDGKVVTQSQLSSVVINDCETKIVESYEYHINTSSPTDLHSQYPEHMKAYRIVQENGVAKLKQLSGFDDFLTYAGTSIRMTGRKGIRVITSIPADKRSALISGGYNGYVTMEYGTIMAWKSDLGDAEPTLNADFTAATKCVKGRSYSRTDGIDAVYSNSGNVVKYTNVLVESEVASKKWTGKYANDFAMRSYIILSPSGTVNDTSDDFVLYGGTLYRSISYVALQNKNSFKPGTAGYEYIWDLIRQGYGSAYNSEYRGS